MFAFCLPTSLVVKSSSHLSHLILALGMACLMLLASPHQPLNAASLKKEDCAALQSLYKNLRLTDEVKAMTKGFEWVKENIKGDKLITIKNFIETEEQLKFRCPSVKWINTFPVMASGKNGKKQQYIPPLPHRKMPGDEKKADKAS